MKKKEHVPNSVTQKAMEDTDNNIDCHTVETVEELIEELEKDD